MKTIKIISAILLLASFSASAYVSPDAGTTAGSFLKIGIGSRMIGMAEAFTAVADDPNALNANIAGLAKIKGMELSVSHVEWVGGLDYEFIAFSKPLFRGIAGMDGIFGLAVNYLHMPASGIFDDYTAQVGTMNYSSVAFTVAYAQEFKNRLRAGLAAKFINESASASAPNVQAVSPAWAVNFNFGLIYSLKIPPFTFLKHPFVNRTLELGVLAENIGQGLANSSSPILLKFGIASSLYDGWLLSMDFQKPVDNRLRYNMGTEFIIKNIVALRGGYRFIGYDVDTFTLGAGLILPLGTKTAKIDFAYAPEGELKTSSNFSLGLKFPGALPDRDKQLANMLYYKGIYYYTNGKLDDAIKAWRECLKLDPTREDARKKIQDAEKLRDLKKIEDELKDTKK